MNRHGFDVLDFDVGHRGKCFGDRDAVSFILLGSGSGGRGACEEVYVFCREIPCGIGEQGGAKENRIEEQHRGGGGEKKIRGEE